MIAWTVFEIHKSNGRTFGNFNENFLLSSWNLSAPNYRNCMCLCLLHSLSILFSLTFWSCMYLVNNGSCERKSGENFCFKKVLKKNSFVRNPGNITYIIDCENVRYDEILMKIWGNSTKKKKFSGNSE